MPFIEIEKMKALREAAKNGDERAKKILQMQLKKEDYSTDLDDFFKPAPAPSAVHEFPNKIDGNPGSAAEVRATKGTGNARLDAFLEDNGVSEGDPEYEDAINDYYNEFPNERPAEEEKPEPSPEAEEQMETAKTLVESMIEVISLCDKTLIDIMQSDQIEDTAKKGAMVSLQEVKQSLMDGIDKLNKIKKSFTKTE